MNVLDRNPTPIIIGGSHRSGTTLVRRILNGNPGIFCPPEIKFHKDLLGQFPKDPLGFARLGHTIKVLGLPLEEWFDEFGKAYVRCMESATQRAGKKRWADKNPENALNIRHWHRLLKGELRFIMVIRNPLDILASIKEHQMLGAIPSNYDDRIQHIKEYINSGLDYCDKNPDLSYVIRYEDIISEPENTLTTLFNWLGEQWNKESIDKLNSHEHGTGLEDPKAKNFKSIQSSSVERWKKDLSWVEKLKARLAFKEISNRLKYYI